MPRFTANNLCVCMMHACDICTGVLNHVFPSTLSRDPSQMRRGVATARPWLPSMPRQLRGWRKKDRRSSWRRLMPQRSLIWHRTTTSEDTPLSSSSKTRNPWSTLVSCMLSFVVHFSCVSYCVFGTMYVLTQGFLPSLTFPALPILPPSLPLSLFLSLSPSLFCVVNA